MTHEQLRQESRDSNRYRQERVAAGEQRFDVWLPAEVAAWLRLEANAKDRTAPFHIRALVRCAYDARTDPSVDQHSERFWKRLAP